MPAGAGDFLISLVSRPLQPLLDDPDVWEVMINAPDEIFVKRHASPEGYHHEVFHDDDHVVRTLTKLLDDASGSHRKLDPSEGLQDAQLDSGARLHIVHGDVSRGGHLMVNIRKFTGVPFRELRELVDRAMLTDQAAAFLRAAVRAGLSIVFAGPPGSGKTTLLSCCAAELDPTLRVVTAEEVLELDIPVANVAALQTRSARPDRPAVDLRRLVSGFLRMAPDVAVVGEVRDRDGLQRCCYLPSAPVTRDDATWLKRRVPLTADPGSAVYRATVGVLSDVNGVATSTQSEPSVVVSLDKIAAAIDPAVGEAAPSSTRAVESGRFS